MKLGQPFSCVAGLAVAFGMLPAVVQADVPAPGADKKSADSKKAAASEAEGYVNRKMAENWKNPEASLKRLGAALTERVKSPEPDNVQKFVEKPANRLLLAQWMMAWQAVHNTHSEAIENSKRAAAGKHTNRDLDMQVQESILEDLPKGAKPLLGAFEGSLEPLNAQVFLMALN